ncbi:MAG: PA14 domain-containing protein [Planctomycetota bacterium]
MWKNCRKTGWGIGGAWLVAAVFGNVALAQDTVARDEATINQDTAPGLSLEIYESETDLSRISIPGVGQTPNVSRRVDRPRFVSTLEGYRQNFVAHYRGELLAPVAGRYTFELTSDDGSRLLINGDKVVDNNDIHPARPREGSAKLSAGAHAIKVWYFQGRGEQSLDLKWKLPGESAFTEIPAEAFRTEAGLTRVVSPGPKRLVEAQSMDVPGRLAPLDAVHPMWQLTTLNPQGPDGFKLTVAGMTILPRGRLAITTFDPRNNGAIVDQPNGKLWLLNGVDGNPNQIAVELISDQLFNPLGVLFHDGSLYVAQRDELTRFAPDEDGRFNQRTTVSDAWESDNYHHFTFGPVFHDGHFYVALSTSIGPGAQKVLRGSTFGYAPNLDGRGSVVKINPDTGNATFITGGHRTPNGLFLGPDGQLFVGDNQGAWQPANKINHVQPGQFYGHYNGNTRTDRFPDGAPPSRFADQPVSPPAVFLPHNEIANSPTDGVVILAGPLAGQMLVSDVKYGGLRRIRAPFIISGRTHTLRSSSRIRWASPPAGRRRPRHLTR